MAPAHRESVRQAAHVLPGKGRHRRYSHMHGFTRLSSLRSRGFIQAFFISCAPLALFNRLISFLSILFYWLIPLFSCVCTDINSAQNLLNGSVEYALRDLTGATIERHDMSSKDFQITRATLGDRRDALWRHLYTCANHTMGFSGHVVGCAWTKATQASAREGGTLQGIQFAVMHTVVGALEYKQFRLLRVRNPWGASFFNGDWSNGSLLWPQAPPALVDLALKVSGGAPQAQSSASNSGHHGNGNVNAPPPVPHGGGDGSDYMKPLGLSDPTCFWISLEDFLQVCPCIRVNVRIVGH